MQFNVDELNAKPFYIGDFTVDVNRGVIFDKNTSFNVEPKVMQVLVQLTSRAQNVVKQEELFQLVWPTSIFSPNSLRRCIATLRKCLNDKDKNLISTHPKIGYSLNVSPQFTTSVPPNKLNNPKPNRLALFIVISVIFVIALLFSCTKDSWHIQKMQPITATEQLEDFLAISPDGHRLAFVRSNTSKKGKIWIKHTNSNKEYPITEYLKNIRNLVWSADGNSLFYVKVTKSGWQIKQQFLTSSLDQPSLVLGNEHSRWISSLHPDSKDNLFFIARNKERLNVYKLDLNTLDVSVLLSSDTGFIPHELTLYDNGSKLAITGQQNQQSLVQLLEITSDNKLQLISSLELPDQQRFSIDWSSSHSEFLLNNGRLLYQLTLEGELTAVNFEHNQFIRFSQFSPNSNHIYLVSSRLDTDLTLHQTSTKSEIGMINSNAMDYAPAISPNNSFIAFYSTRFNKPQLFIYQRETKTDELIFNNPDDFLNVDPPLWSHSGKQLAFSIGQQTHIYQRKQQRWIKFNKSIQGVVEGWFADDQHILIRKPVNKAFVLVKVEIQTGQEEVLGETTSTNVYINQKNEIYLIGENSIKQWNANKKLKTITRFEHPVSRQFVSQSRLYLSFKNEPMNWQRWSNLSVDALLFQTPSNSQLVAINQEQTMAITSQGSRSRDILRLTLK